MVESKKYERAVAEIKARDDRDARMRPWLVFIALSLLAFLVWSIWTNNPSSFRALEHENPFAVWAAVFGVLILIYCVSDFLYCRKPAEDRLETSISDKQRLALKQKLIAKFYNQHDVDILAEDIIKLIAVSKSELDAFRAANRELDRQGSLNSKQS